MKIDDINSLFTYSSSMILPSRIELADTIIESLKIKNKIAIVGQAGSGKTFLCRYLYNNLYNDVNAVWIDRNSVANIQYLELNEIADVQSTLIILDGFDELQKNQQKSYEKYFKRLENAQVIISSRFVLDGFFIINMNTMTNDDMRFLLKERLPDKNIDLTHLNSLAAGNPLVGVLLISLLQLDNSRINSEINNYYGKFDLHSYSLKLIELISYLGKIAYEKGNYNDSLQLYTFLLKTQNEEELIKVYNNIANVYQTMGNYDIALDYSKKALAIANKIFSEPNSILATTYNNIGGIYDLKGELFEAEEYYLKSLELRKKLYGLDHLDVANSYSNIGGIFFTFNDYDKALEFYKKAFEIRLKILGENHPSIAIMYNNMGSVYEHQAADNMALQYYFKALSIYQKCLGNEHPDIGITCNNIAFIYEAKNDYTSALEWYYKSYSIFIKSFGDQHLNTTTVKLNMMSAYFKSNQNLEFNKWLESKDVKQSL